jgi:hypothetical protein
MQLISIDPTSGSTTAIRKLLLQHPNRSGLIEQLFDWQVSVAMQTNSIGSW